MGLRGCELVRIALLNAFYYPTEPGGAERSVRLLADELARQGHDVSVICLDEGRSSDRVGDVRVERLPIRNIYLPVATEEQVGAASRLAWHTIDAWNPLSASQLGGVLTKLQPDVVHTNNLAGMSVSAWHAARSRGIPVVHTTRDFYLLCPRSTMMRDGHSCARPCAACRPFGWPKKLASRGVSQVVGISRFILERHLDCGYFQDVPASVIYNPFETSVNVDRVPGETLRLGFIGRIVASKGLAELMEAVRQLRVRGRRVELLVAGEGRVDFVEALRAQFADVPAEFLGQVAPEALFSAVDLTVVPSQWSEPLGRVVIESLAFGRPVVAAPVGGIPELCVAPCVRLAASPAASDLADAIDSMIDEVRADAQSLACACRRAASAFALRPVAERYMTVFRAAVESPRQALAG